MIERAEKVAAGDRPIKKDRFVKLDGATQSVDWTLVDRARQLAGLKGYVTSIDQKRMTGQAVINAYHDLWQVEKSFRMAKSDLRARPIFHHQRESIEAHLTIVFAALAVSRHLQDLTGVSIKSSCAPYDLCRPSPSMSAGTPSPPSRATPAPPTNGSARYRGRHSQANNLGYARPLPR